MTTDPPTLGTAPAAESELTVTLNDEERTLPAGTTCRRLVEQITGRAVGPDGRPAEGAGLGIALAIRGQLVPRARWDSTPVRDGDVIEVVTAVQGG